MGRHDLRDREWELLEPLLPPPSKRGRKPTPPRRILNGIFWILGTGAPWRDLPDRHPPWRTVYHRFNTWRKTGVWDALLDSVLEILDERGQLDDELWCVDGTSIRAHRVAAGAGKKGGLKNQITMILDALAAGIPPSSISSVIERDTSSD